MDDQYAALDVEATGMDPVRHEVIEVAVVVFSRERELDRFTSLVRPRARVSLDSATLTGITHEELRGAPPLSEIGATVRRLTAGRPVVGHSIDMDLAMLTAGGVSIASPQYDTHQIATLLLPDLPNYSLAAVAEALGLPLGVEHRALSDAVVAANVFRAMLAKIDEIDTLTLERVASLARSAGMPTADLFLEALRRRPTGPLFVVSDTPTQGPHEMAFLVPRERPEALRRTGSKREIDEATVSAALQPGGALSQVVGGYEHRRPQEQMALAVARAFNDDQQVLVEAGTGTGKSVAYLLPAAMHARERGETVVVSTNTLALQDQLFRKDIPDLKRALDGNGDQPPFEAAVLKGRQNYLCLRRWFASQRQPVGGPDEAALRAKVLLWLGETETGDRAELRLTAEEESQFRHISAEGEACSASRCVFQQRNQCFLFRARREAEHAHLVVVNHALLLSDTMEGGRILPDYEHLIVDEAHHLEDQATNQFGFSVSEAALHDVLDSAIRVDGPMFGGTVQLAINELARAATNDADRTRAASALERARALLTRSSALKLSASDLFARLREIVDQTGQGSSGYDRSLRITPQIRRQSQWVEVEVAWERVDRDLISVEADLAWFLESVERLPTEKDKDDDLGAVEDLAVDLLNAIRQSGEFRAKLAEIVIDPSDEAVYWIERDNNRGTVSLRAAPLHVGPFLQERLFDRLRTVVLTSATLTTDGGFEYVRERLGLETAKELAVASPFDYERSTLLYLVDDIPEPNAPGYQRDLQDVLIELGMALGGKTLVLFTSHAALQATYRAIKAPLEDRGVVVLAQRSDGSARQLIERLKHSDNVMLLGTSTFWEGVDVVGSALSALVIAKLPFSVPSDPVFAARGEGFDEPFQQYAIPQAVLKFKQGFGRLIRSSHDRGVCAVLDRRVISKRYGASFIQSLPPCTVEVAGAADLPAASVAWLESVPTAR
ncbi:MAG: ATP-dependent helicase DinG [Thermomicrobiales bacterium]|nr:ATP-dependent helicase DinG [Thermomicrobiales bacterium]